MKKSLSTPALPDTTIWNQFYQRGLLPIRTARKPGIPTMQLGRTDIFCRQNGGPSNNADARETEFYRPVIEEQLSCSSRLLGCVDIRHSAFSGMAFVLRLMVRPFMATDQSSDHNVVTINGDWRASHDALFKHSLGRGMYSRFADIGSCANEHQVERKRTGLPNKQQASDKGKCRSRFCGHREVLYETRKGHI